MARPDPLAALIQRSPVLDEVARDYWVRLLPHLTPGHRERLLQILSEEETDGGRVKQAS